jgi:type II secretory ATPase GspE/PulE/Tfp pilus assembly ATPase PilB-like protein
MTTMLHDGVEKAAQGITTVEEVLRVLVGQQDADG